MFILIYYIKRDSSDAKHPGNGDYMKIDRMIGILAVLLKQDRVTAPELAERFEVSKRTINRDIEALFRKGFSKKKQKEILEG